jgi:sigma-B regulation protein RsbU (phosphoserine phosphatase)
LGWEIWLHTQPANEVGGDLVDYLEVRENGWGIALGDVAGKGLGAALLMAKVQATLRALAPGFPTLADLARELNHIIYRDGLRNRFVSLVYLELTAGSGEVRFVNAGHLPPLLVRHDVLQSMPRGAPALGILPDASYQEEEIALDSGDLFCIFSDGVTEAINGEGQFFGESRLMSLLEKHQGFSAQTLGEQILSEVKAFIGDEPPSDDLSLAILKRVR